MMELIHITATYSNAVLVAVLPHVSDFSKKLDLPIPQPVTIEQVRRFNPSPYKDRVEGALWLTNDYWFVFDHAGYVQGFRSPDNIYYNAEDAVANPTNYLGRTQMSTNEMLAFARETLLKLGYKPEITRADAPPEIQYPFNLNSGGHMPYCQMTWRFHEDNRDSYSNVRVEINTQDKKVVGLFLLFARTNKIGTPLKLDIEPELLSDYRQRTKLSNMYVRTNAPPRPSSNQMAVVTNSLPRTGSLSTEK